MPVLRPMHAGETGFHPGRSAVGFGSQRPWLRCRAGMSLRPRRWPHHPRMPLPPEPRSAQRLYPTMPRYCERTGAELSCSRFRRPATDWAAPHPVVGPQQPLATVPWFPAPCRILHQGLVAQGLPVPPARLPRSGGCGLQVPESARLRRFPRYGVGPQRPRHVRLSSSIEAAVSSSALACCSVRPDRSSLPSAICTLADDTPSALLRAFITTAESLTPMPFMACISWPNSSRRSTRT